MKVPDFPFPFPIIGEVITSDPFVRKEIYRTYGGIDFWTRAPIEYEAMVLDHIWPQSLGGPSNVFNLVPTTGPVNTGRKNAFDLEAITAVLAIVRMNYGSRVVHALGSKPMRIPGHLACYKSPPKWLVTDHQLMNERIRDPFGKQAHFIKFVEEKRMTIASFIRTAARDLGDERIWEAGEALCKDLGFFWKGQKVLPEHFKYAWMNVVTVRRRHS